jgi:hypothetical protein
MDHMKYTGEWKTSLENNLFHTRISRPSSAWYYVATASASLAARTHSLACDFHSVVRYLAAMAL